jgi:hypothetical protein
MKGIELPVTTKEPQDITLSIIEERNGSAYQLAQRILYIEGGSY